MSDMKNISNFARQNVKTLEKDGLILRHYERTSTGKVGVWVVVLYGVDEVRSEPKALAMLAKLGFVKSDLDRTYRLTVTDADLAKA